jgi:hypothetical protein
MKVDLITNATVVEKAVHFVDRQEVLCPQTRRLSCDD